MLLSSTTVCYMAYLNNKEINFKEFRILQCVKLWVLVTFPPLHAFIKKLALATSSEKELFQQSPLNLTTIPLMASR